ncbi:MAG: hypothetical protein M3383_03395 [Actinomycetota bacterium]|nr:hypothetical protein [Actinomycetota bacterium]
MSGFRNQRAIGPVGTTARVVAGVSLIVVPIASRGLSAWDAAGALLVLPAIALVLHRLLTAAVARLVASDRRMHSTSQATWAVHLSALILIIATATALTFVTAIDGGAIWLFFGLSLLVVAVRDDAGCEALGIPNALLGHRSRTGCIVFAPLDSLEAERSGRAYGS